MKPPEDITDYSQCVKSDDEGNVFAFCVECDDWQRVAISCKAAIVCHFYSDRTSTIVRDHYDFIAICQRCETNIDYLLDASTKNKLIKRI